MNKTLWAFGCSETFGLFLPDAIPEKVNLDGSIGIPPSNLAWPSLLAKHLGYECKNLAQPGNSNKGIVQDIISCIDLIKPNDIVCIQWTFVVRNNVYTADGKNLRINSFARDRNNKPIETKSHGAKIIKLYEKFLSRIDYDKTYTEELSFFIDYINLKLPNEVYNFITQNRFTLEKLGNASFMSTKILSSNYIRNNYPLAIDGVHTGQLGHEAIAKHYYELIKRSKS